ncbi:uncharacterized protein [Rutidosis leptorrhynchoides]|uniref:uncharacterized protein n=1 Tax=Rutidosis leptorrhynchoides TaxID=125765 RepID=UPI003A99C968
MKIKSCLVFALLLLFVTYTLAVKTSQPETVTENVKGPEDASKVGAYGGGGSNYGGGGGGSWGGGGYGCRHGCCYRGYYHGGCPKCCYSPEEAKAFAAQVNP